jgi:hypothetical protein
MRAPLLLSIGLFCVAFAQPANSIVPISKAQTDARQPIIKIAQRCPPGSWWIPEGYQRKGKWKPGHCSKVTTRSS